jgi:lysophospholipid acyltransferase (LPLAT)-like uncharacterized protein
MLKKLIKWILNTHICQSVVANLIYIYLLLVYKTTKWTFVNDDNIYQSKRTIFLGWHSYGSMATYVISKINNIYNLSTTHKDGRIFANILKKFGINIIDGSTFKNPVGAIIQILNMLKANNNVSLTPDGPRGPKEQINSNVINIAKKVGADIVCIKCKFTKKYIFKNSWDQFELPLPFGSCEVIFSDKIHVENLTNEELRDSLQKL